VVSWGGYAKAKAFACTGYLSVLIIRARITLHFGETDGWVHVRGKVAMCVGLIATGSMCRRAGRSREMGGGAGGVD
jgi:hypothetical protein